MVYLQEVAIERVGKHHIIGLPYREEFGHYEYAPQQDTDSVAE